MTEHPGGFHAQVLYEPSRLAANPSTKDTCHWLRYIERQALDGHFHRL